MFNCFLKIDGFSFFRIDILIIYTRSLITRSVSFFFPFIQNENKKVNGENILIVYVQWAQHDNEQMLCKCKTHQRLIMSKNRICSLVYFDVIYFYRTEQNPNGCCDGYKWDSAVYSCVGLYSVIIWTYMDIIYILNLKHNIS